MGRVLVGGQNLVCLNHYGKEPDTVSEYVFKLKKGDLELELKSDDPQFIETQMDNWRNMLITQQEN